MGDLKLSKKMKKPKITIKATFYGMMTVGKDGYYGGKTGWEFKAETNFPIIGKIELFKIQMWRLITGQDGHFGVETGLDFEAQVLKVFKVVAGWRARWQLSTGEICGQIWFEGWKVSPMQLLQVAAGKKRWQELNWYQIVSRISTPQYCLHVMDT